MLINGIQKLTLLDFPGRTACIVFLAGCDLRCPYCHNSELWTADAPAVMTDAELISFLEKRRGMLDGVVFTGGEALLREELPDVMRSVKSMGYAVKLDTNGTHPDGLEKLIEDGLIDYAAMDIKNDWKRYAVTCGRESMDLEPVKRSVEILLSDRVPYEFRTTVLSPFHDDTSFENIGRIIEGAANYFLQPFADRDTVMYKGFSAPTEEQLQRYAQIVKPFVARVGIRGM